MITLSDIETKEFSRGMRGYKEEEVDEFLNVLIVEFDSLMRENKALREENERIKAEIEGSKASE